MRGQVFCSRCFHRKQCGMMQNIYFTWWRRQCDLWICSARNCDICGAIINCWSTKRSGKPGTGQMVFMFTCQKNLQLFLSRISAMVIHLDFCEERGKMAKRALHRPENFRIWAHASVLSNPSMLSLPNSLSKATLKNHKKIKTTFHCHQPTFLKTKFDQPLISTNQGRSIGNCILVTTVVRFIARFRYFFQRFTNCSSVFYVTMCFWPKKGDMIKRGWHRWCHITSSQQECLIFVASNTSNVKKSVRCKSLELKIKAVHF